MAAIIGTILDSPYSDAEFLYSNKQDVNNIKIIEEKMEKNKSSIRLEAWKKKYSAEERERKYLEIEPDASLLPKTIIINEEQYLFDFYSYYYGLRLVSDKFKSCVEEFEPAQHRFIPVSMLNKAGDKVGDYYFLQIKNIVNAIKVKNKDRASYSIGNLEAVYKNQVSDFCMWLDVGLPRYIFISDALKKRLMDHQISNCKVRHLVAEI